MTDILVNPLALAWKHNNTPGITTRENAQGQMVLAAWPAALGVFPTQAQADTWASEYAARDSKGERADAGLGTVQNKTILDALWELHRAIRGQIVLPAETKAQYADRIKAAWKANEL